jgi:hypothetical protein
MKKCLAIAVFGALVAQQPAPNPGANPPSPAVVDTNLWFLHRGVIQPARGEGG